MFLVNEKGVLIQEDNEEKYEKINILDRLRSENFSNPFESVDSLIDTFSLRLRDKSEKVTTMVVHTIEKLLFEDTDPLIEREDAIKTFDPTRRKLYEYYQKVKKVKYD